MLLWAVPRLAEAKVPTSQAFGKPHQESQSGFKMRCFGSPGFSESFHAWAEHGLKVIVLRCRGIYWRDGTRVLGLASGSFIVLRRLLKRAPPRDRERIWYHKRRIRKIEMSSFHILVFHSSLFISVSQRIKLLNWMLHLWELGQLLYSMSFSDIANNKVTKFCEWPGNVTMMKLLLCLVSFWLSYRRSLAIR